MAYKKPGQMQKKNGPDTKKNWARCKKSRARCKKLGQMQKKKKLGQMQKAGARGLPIQAPTSLELPYGQKYWRELYLVIC